jgi:hypothetical protein
MQPKSRQATLLEAPPIRLSSYDAKILGGILAQIEWKVELKDSDP